MSFSGRGRLGDTVREGEEERGGGEALSEDFVDEISFDKLEIALRNSSLNLV